MGYLLNILITIIIILFFPLGEVARIQWGNTAITALDCGVCMLGSIGIVLVGKRYIKHPIFMPLVIFVLCCVVSLLVNARFLTFSELITAALYIVRLIFYFALLPCYLYFFKRDYIKKLFTISGIILLLFGFIQFFLYPNLRNLYYLGWDPHEYRMFGSLLDPNFFGCLLVLFLLFWLTQITQAKQKVTYICLSFITTIAIALTFSRSAYSMGIVAIISFFFLKKSAKFMFMILFFISIVITLSPFISNKSEGTRLFRVTSTIARFASAQQAVQVFEKNPIFGVGFNAYRYALKRYRLDISKQVTISHAAAGTDNSFLFVLATTGSIGFICYCYLWVSIVIYAYKAKNAFLFAASIGLLVDSLFVNSLFYPVILFFFWSMMGVMG